jgi:hypothetical protein
MLRVAFDAADSKRLSSDASISGHIIQYGGAAPIYGQPSPVPLSAIAVVYADDDPTKMPVAQARSSEDNGGRFVIHLPAGNYDIMAQGDRGAVISAPEHVRVADGQSVTVELQVIVP